MLSVINEARWHLAEGSFPETILDISHVKVFENYISENTATSLGGQWVIFSLEKVTLMSFTEVFPE